MFFNAAAVIACLASFVAANGADIVEAVNSISANNTAFNLAISAWDGKFADVQPVLAAAGAFQNDIERGTMVVNASMPLTSDEATQVYNALLTFGHDLTNTLNTLVAAKPKFDAASLSPMIADFLLGAHSDMSAFDKSYFAKTPVEYQTSEREENLDAHVTGIFATVSIDFRLDGLVPQV